MKIIITIVLVFSIFRTGVALASSCHGGHSDSGGQHSDHSATDTASSTHAAHVTQKEETAITIDGLIPPYLRLQQALALDSLTKASEAADFIVKSIPSEKKDLNEIRAAAERIKTAKDLKEARKYFKTISKPFVKWAKENKPPRIIALHCPMAGASWVQNDGETLNPYLGKEMLKCGEKIK